jgi:hypothetical protein
VDLAALGAGLPLRAFGGWSRCPWQQRHASRFFYHLGDEGAYGFSASGQGAANGAVGTDEDGARGVYYPVGFGDLPVFLEQDVLQAMLLRLGTVLLWVSSAN